MVKINNNDIIVVEICSWNGFQEYLKKKKIYENHGYVVSEEKRTDFGTIVIFRKNHKAPK